VAASAITATRRINIRMNDESCAGQTERPGRTDAGRQPPATVAIEFPDVVDAKGCTSIPNSVLDDTRLVPETRLVYVMLRRLGASNPRRPIDREELARSIGIPMHRISRHLTLLERSGRIRVRREGRASARTPIRYRLAKPAVLEDDPLPRLAAVASQSQTRRAATGNAGLSLVDRLIVVGVHPQVAERLVADYPKERVAGALRAAHRRRPLPRNPAAWVVTAIRQGWVAPTATSLARQRQAAQEQAITAWEHQADTALAALPADTQQSLRRQAAQAVERRFDQRLASTAIGAMLVTAEVRRLVAEQVGIPAPDAITDGSR
jgi:DNA-binding transcriptional ArsR family regulator